MATMLVLLLPFCVAAGYGIVALVYWHEIRMRARETRRAGHHVGSTRAVSIPLWLGAAIRVIADTELLQHESIVARCRQFAIFERLRGRLSPAQNSAFELVGRS